MITKTTISITLSEKFSDKLWNEYGDEIKLYDNFLQYLQHNIDNKICWLEWAGIWSGIGLPNATIYFKEDLHLTWFLLKYSEELN